MGNNNLIEGLKLDKSVTVASKKKGIPFTDKEKSQALKTTATYIRKLGGIPTSNAGLVGALKADLAGITPKECVIRNQRGDITKTGERPWASYNYLANASIKKLKAMVADKTTAKSA